MIHTIQEQDNLISFVDVILLLVMHTCTRTLRRSPEHILNVFQVQYELGTFEADVACSFKLVSNDDIYSLCRMKSV